MLNQLITLQRWVLHLINKFDEWETEAPNKSRSALAVERRCFVQKCLRAILRLLGEVLGSIQASENEAMQQHPAFWLEVEGAITWLYKQDTELDGVWVLITKESAIGKEFPNYGRIDGLAPMGGLVL